MSHSLGILMCLDYCLSLRIFSLRKGMFPFLSSVFCLIWCLPICYESVKLTLIGGAQGARWWPGTNSRPQTKLNWGVYYPQALEEVPSMPQGSHGEVKAGCREGEGESEAGRMPYWSLWGSLWGSQAKARLVRPNQKSKV